jgi:hypothetical protein
MNDQQLNLQERLVRYNEKCLADEKTSFCEGKQKLDIAVLQGKQPKDIQKMASPVKGQPLFFDPLNSQLLHVKQRRKEMDLELNDIYKAKDFQDSIAEIPKVAYHPATLLTQLQKKEITLKNIGRIAKSKPSLWKEEDFYSPEKGDSVNGSINSSLKINNANNANNKSINISATVTTGTGQGPSSPQYDNAGNVLPEASLQLAMLKAKSGDTRSLYQLFMAADPEYKPTITGTSHGNNNGNVYGADTGGQMQIQQSLLDDMGSLANSDFNFLNADGSINTSQYIEDVQQGSELASASVVEPLPRLGSAPQSAPHEEGQNEEVFLSEEELKAQMSTEMAVFSMGASANAASSVETSAQLSPSGSTPAFVQGSVPANSRPGTGPGSPAAMASPYGSAPSSAQCSVPASSRPVTAPISEVGDGDGNVNVNVTEDNVKNVTLPPVIVDVPTTEETVAKISPEINSAFFGSAGNDFEALSLEATDSDVKNTALIDQEQSRSAPIKRV